MKQLFLTCLIFVLLTGFLNTASVSAQNTKAATNSEMGLIQAILNLFFNGLAGSNTNQPLVNQTTTTISTITIASQEAKVFTVDTSVARQLLPNPLPALTSNAQSVKQSIITMCVANKPIYVLAQNATGVPWQYLAGIHMVEGGCGREQSLVSGRMIGSMEPDVGNNCSEQGAGKPYVLPGGGCGFLTLLDSAIYAGNLIKVKNGGTVPSSFAEAVQAAAFYNGNGNTNCGKTDFPYCPPRYKMPFPYWDHIHPMNYFDEYHDRMYVVYCADRKTCQELGLPNPIYRMPGVMTTMRILVEGGY